MNRCVCVWKSWNGRPGNPPDFPQWVKSHCKTKSPMTAGCLSVSGAFWDGHNVCCGKSETMHWSSAEGLMGYDKRNALKLQRSLCTAVSCLYWLGRMLWVSVTAQLLWVYENAMTGLTSLQLVCVCVRVCALGVQWRSRVRVTVLYLYFVCVCFYVPWPAILNDWFWMNGYHVQVRSLHDCVVSTTMNAIVSEPQTQPQYCTPTLQNPLPLPLTPICTVPSPSVCPSFHISIILISLFSMASQSLQ